MARLPAAPLRMLLITCAIVGSLTYGTRLRADHDDTQRRLTENFELGYKKPAGWRELSHGPQALFIYQDPKTGLRYRGSVNQVVAEFNPTPALNSDKLAEQMVSNTEANMPGWKGIVLDSVTTPAVDWRLVRREGQDRCVVSAFGVRGNTTVLISLVGRGGEIKHMPGHMETFRGFLRTLTFDKADLEARYR